MLSTQKSSNTAFLAKPGHTIKSTEYSNHQSSSVQGKSQKNDYRDNLWCTYCRKTCHTKERCYKLHGKPQSYENQVNQVNQAHMVIDSSSNQKFEQTDPRNIESTPSSEVEKLHLELEQLKAMVIDSGATDHMTNLSYHFLTYTLCSNDWKVFTTDGTLLTVTGIGDLTLEPLGILTKVLHVSKLFTNLISVKSLVKNTSYHAFFDEDLCVFLDKVQKQRIGVARVRGGLYILEGSSQTSCTKYPLYPSANFISYHKISPSYKTFLATLDNITILVNISEALSKKEYKARLLVKGYTQVYRIDYHETFFSFYADDIIITGSDDIEQGNLSKYLVKEFNIKTLGCLKYFLGIEVAHSSKGIFISQRKYVADLLKDTGKFACKPPSTPLNPNHKLSVGKGEECIDREMYQCLIGRLIYLTHTRPDISYVVSLLSQFMHRPTESHLHAAYQMYVDANYAGSLLDRRSTSGLMMFMGGNLVTWHNKKQNVAARSSVEAEFKALTHGIYELLWVKILLTDLKIPISGPMKLYCDNKSTINLVHNPIQHDRTKHVEIDRHLIKENLESKEICIPYISTQHQLADLLTKGVSATQLQQVRSKLGMDDIHSPT
ncbi:unnamed protein product [Spirodela intermedia]|uniref:Uncharacterized protein n=1 Tax=Spirodela intermedia TaxID=51605 RepID=A0A7I8JXW8_SPIIN|nr:unnamed protein product [Spirodela intermedia]